MSVSVVEPQRRHLAAILLLLTFAVYAVYSQVGSFEFNSSDDRLYVTANQLVTQGLTSPGIQAAFTRPIAANWHPLTIISHMLDVELFDLHSGAHHHVNALLHLANTLLLFAVLRRMTKDDWLSAIIAALFALHPLHVESVAWVAQRKDVLSGLFAMLTLWAYSRYAARSRLVDYFALTLFFAAGLLSKPTLITLPVLLLLLDFWPLGRSPFSVETNANYPKQSLRRLILEKVPLALLALACSIATFAAQSSFHAVASLERFPLSVRLANAVVSYARYLGKAIWPADLCFFYPHPGMWPWPIVLGATLLLVIFTVAGVLHARSRPWLIAGWLWFIISLLPVIGLVQAGEQAMADRYMYLPLIGLGIIAACFLREFSSQRPHLRRLVFGGTAILLAAFAFVGRAQAAHWRSSKTLYTRVLSLYPDNATAHHLMADIFASSGQLERAIHHYREALRIRPGFDATHHNLGHAFLGAGALRDATNHLAEAVRLNPLNAPARFQLGLALVALGEARNALPHYRHVRNLVPNDPIVANELAWLLSTHPDDQVRNADEALPLAVHACELTGYREPATLATLAAAYANAGRFDEAVKIAERAVAQAEASGNTAIHKRTAAVLSSARSGEAYRFHPEEALPVQQ